MAARSPKPTTTTVKTAIASPKSAKSAVAKGSPKKEIAPPSSVKRTASEVTNVKPKKALSAYFIWLNESRAEIIAKKCGGNGSNVSAVAKAAGEMWKSMSDADKKKWVDLAEKDKLRHAKEMESYVPSETSGPEKKKGKKGKKEKDPNKPKRGLSAYMFFLKEARAEIIRVDLKGDGSKVAEVTKIGGAKWAKLDAKGREKFERLAAQDKERYEKEIAEYKKTNGGDDDDDEEDEE